MLPIRDEVEDCDEEVCLVELPEEFIMIFLGEKSLDKLVTSVSNHSEIVKVSVEGFLRLLFFFQFQPKDQIKGTLPLILREIGD
jgi:hypothetical protein